MNLLFEDEPMHDNDFFLNDRQDGHVTLLPDVGDSIHDATDGNTLDDYLIMVQICFDDLIPCACGRLDSHLGFTNALGDDGVLRYQLHYL